MTYFYIYLLIDPRNDQPFYVGKGKYVPGKLQRWRSHILEAKQWDESCYWGNTEKLRLIKDLLTQNIEPYCQIPHKSEREDEIYKLEKEYVAFYGRKKFDKDGILTNLSPGGGGLESQHAFKADYKKLRQLQYLGERNPMYGVSRDPSVKTRISETRKQHIEEGIITPHTHSEQHKQSMRGSNPGGDATSKAVAQICPETGHILQTWPSTRKAAQYVDVGVWRNISHVCNYHKGRLCGGYYWRWIDDPDISDGVLANLKLLNYKRLGKPIYQLDQDYNYVNLWKNMKQIADYYGVTAGTFTHAVKNHRLFRGFYWQYA